MNLNAELSKKLFAYSVFANAAALAGNMLHGQVVYVDIEPDIILDSNGEEYLLDIDGDGINDFRFINNSFLFPNESTAANSSHMSLLRQDLAAGPLLENNALAGLSDYVDAEDGGFTMYFPYRMNQNNRIDSSLSWQNEESQLLIGVEKIQDEKDPVNIGGYWTGDDIDKFLGIRFKDDDNQKHYGWVRCDVKDDGRTLVIKDYAIELEANQAIKAGSKTAIDDNIMRANVYYAENDVHVALSTPPLQIIYCSIFDINGKELFRTRIMEQHTALELDLEAGVYALKLFASKIDFGGTFMVVK